MRPPGFREWEEVPPSGEKAGQAWVGSDSSLKTTHIDLSAFPLLRASGKCHATGSSVSKPNGRVPIEPSVHCEAHPVHRVPDRLDGPRKLTKGDS